MIKVPPNISQIRLEAMKNLKEHVNFSQSVQCAYKSLTLLIPSTSSIINKKMK